MNKNLKILFLNRSAVKKIKHPNENSAIVSIYTPGDRPVWLSPEWRFVHRDSFFDTEAWEDQMVYPTMNEHQAERIFLFIKNVIEVYEVETLVVNCDAGMSRSGAIATFVAEKYGCGMLPPDAPHYNRTIYRLLKEAENRYMTGNQIPWEN
jgi:predicted protein tyrosine phosphatase